MPGVRAKISLLLAAAAMVLLLVPATAPAANGRIQGKVMSGKTGLFGFRVKLMQARPGAKSPRTIGTGSSRVDGSFTLRYRGALSSAVHYLVANRPGGGAEAGFEVPAPAYRLALSLGSGSVPRRATLNDRTTVAMAFTLAQFLRGARVAGKNPGLKNAAAMSSNLVIARTGALSPVLRAFPNGNSTSTLATLDTLANLVAGCRLQGRGCARFLGLSDFAKRGSAADTLHALTLIATNPWHNVRALFQLSRAAKRVYRPLLGRGDKPDAWTLALRFEGRKRTMNGPGNFAIDAGGSLWVANNYEYSRDAHESVCGSELLLRFTPTGKNYPGAPYEGGGINGVGFGIAIDPRGRVWTGNFGFAGKGCETPPPSNSVSLFSRKGKPLSPSFHEPLKEPGTIRGGFEAGEISWPQGTVSDRDGNIWIANCGNESVTRYGNGLPTRATNLKEIGVQRPFDIAVGARGSIFVTSNDNDQVTMLEPDGSVARIVGEHGIDRPMGIATDSRGFIWIANSGKVVPPCKGTPLSFEGGPQKGTVTVLKPNGGPARATAIRGAGMQTPWGVAVDGDDTVWIANFSGQRVSQVCGARPKLCPPGKRAMGRSISPPGTGYGFDGLTRNTGVAVDPSGNVWLANNWKQVPFQTNPGGYQIVAFLGLAEPVATPVIGPPERP